ncbi:phenylalanine--tRNA ligase subunit alpha [candidate division KSB1 bacterium]|nr:MAG: phenylalanine--tRNA ligase subunit alpha [candidate division KSB1 bacterium]
MEKISITFVELKELVNNFFQDKSGITNFNEAEKVRFKYLGRKGLISSLFKKIKEKSPSERALFGKELNFIKSLIKQEIEEKLVEFEKISEKEEKIDITLPGRKFFLGSKHPINIILEEIKDAFYSMGFEVATGPEIETDYYNFEALNMPENHPSRDLQDTLYLDSGGLLRTHTSPVQIRVMEKMKPPVRIIAPGRVFRKDTPDATHSPVFYQVEGLCVDRDVSMADLKGVILSFARHLFGRSAKVRFRPSFFPFTEPSAEYDFSCILCRGKGCSVCKNTGWIEISGAGMVDPEVFKFVGYDPEVFTGFAFGMGVERIAMVKFEIDDIRLFYENDLRFIKQFS